MGRGTEGLPAPMPHVPESRYLYRLCDLLGDVLDQLDARTRPTTSGPDLVTEPAPDKPDVELVDDQSGAKPVDQDAATGAPTGDQAEPEPEAKPQQGSRRARRGRK